MAAAAFNDIAAWILLALVVALVGDGDGDGGGHKSPLISIWVLLSGAAFIAFMLVFIRPSMKWAFFAEHPIWVLWGFLDGAWTHG